MTGFALSGGSRPAPAPAIGLGGSASFPAAQAAAAAAGDRPVYRGAGRRRRGRAGAAAVVLEPVQVVIPAICVRASVIPLGVNPDGTVRVPPLSMPRTDELAR